MIWHRGAIVDPESVRVSVMDRSFEHGLGLFETLRTWNGDAILLSRHLERLTRSARELGLPLDPDTLPDEASVRALREANQIRHDARVRITLSGGRAAARESRESGFHWMTATALDETRPAPGAIVDEMMMVVEADPLARHKTLNYWRKAIANAAALASGAHDVLCVTASGWLCESSRYNLFLVEGERLLTASTDLPILPGIMRGLVIERAVDLGLHVQEGHLGLDRAEAATEAFLTNSVRGIVPISRLLRREMPAPGGVTERMGAELRTWLASRGMNS